MALPLNKAKDVCGLFKYLPFVISSLLGLFSLSLYISLSFYKGPEVVACILCAEIVANHLASKNPAHWTE